MSAGAVIRVHPAYAINPFDIFSGGDYIDVANSLGFNDFYNWNDINNNGLVDRFEDSYYYWTNPAGDTIANSNSEFMQYHYSDIVNGYNANQINKLGNQITISSVIGISYYTHRDNYHTLIWSNILPYNYAYTDYGY